MKNHEGGIVNIIIIITFVVSSLTLNIQSGWKMMLAIVLIYVLLSLLLLCGMVVLLRWKLVGKTIDKEQPRKGDN